MSARTASRFAWFVCASSLALTAVSLLLFASNLLRPNVQTFEYWVEVTVLATSASLIGALLLLLFPDGKLPSRRWRVFAWVIPMVSLAGSAIVAFAPGPVDGLGPIENPLGLDALGIVGKGSTVELVKTFLLLPLEVGAVASLVVRLRHSDGVEHQQVKWLAYAMVVTVVGGTLTYVLYDVATVPWWLGWAGFVLLMVAVGIAVLRYRLYDIDVIINRTLVYSVLTAILVAVYFGSVAAAQAIFRALVGQEEQPQLAIVISTFVIAALFNPLRRRIQSFIDRLFYRSKYDAAKTLEGFSMRLRDETDLEALQGDLVEVVREMMQPSHVSLWLRPGAAGQRRQPG